MILAYFAPSLDSVHQVDSMTLVDHPMKKIHPERLALMVRILMAIIHPRNRGGRAAELAHRGDDAT